MLCGFRAYFWMARHLLQTISAEVMVTSIQMSGGFFLSHLFASPLNMQEYTIRKPSLLKWRCNPSRWAVFLLLPSLRKCIEHAGIHNTQTISAEVTVQSIQMCGYFVAPISSQVHWTCRNTQYANHLCWSDGAIHPDERRFLPLPSHRKCIERAGIHNMQTISAEVMMKARRALNFSSPISSQVHCTCRNTQYELTIEIEFSALLFIFKENRSLTPSSAWPSG